MTAHAVMEGMHAAKVHSVGYLVRLDKKEIVLTGSFSPEDTFTEDAMLNVLTIPRPWVTRIRKFGPRARLVSVSK